jgi:hypothetical protein
MKTFTVKIKPIKRGIRTYYKPLMRLNLCGVKVWTSFSVSRSYGKYYFLTGDASSLQAAEETIKNLKYIYGEAEVTVLPMKV